MNSTHTVSFSDLQAPVDEVTLFEDRAQILRRASITLQPGRQLWAVRDVAPVLADKTISIRATADCRVSVESRIERLQRSAEQRSERDTEDLEKQLLELQAESAIMQSRLNRLESRLRDLGETAVQMLDDIVTDVSWARPDPETWRSSVADGAILERDVRTEALEVRYRIEELEETIGDLETRIAISQRPDLRLAADILLDISADSSAACTLEIRYMVPSACWRPQHTARLIGGDHIEFASDATVWQRTGEDWTDAALKFSTQRPSLGFEAPLLDDDVLTVQEKPETEEIEVREQEISTTGLGAGARAASELPGIDDGGEALTMVSENRHDVPSDGRPHRIPIGSFRSPARLDDVLVAELATAVICKATLDNGGPRPILAGPVDVGDERGLIGRTSTLFIAPGERFALGCGPQPCIRVRRRVDEVDLKASALSRQRRRRCTVTLLISNIGIETRSFEVTERIPVSEVESVKILFDPEYTTDRTTPDKDGMLVWKVEIPGNGRTRVKLRYTIEKHKDVEGL